MWIYSWWNSSCNSKKCSWGNFLQSYLLLGILCAYLKFVETNYYCWQNIWQGGSLEIFVFIKYWGLNSLRSSFCVMLIFNFFFFNHPDFCGKFLLLPSRYHTGISPICPVQGQVLDFDHPRGSLLIQNILWFYVIWILPAKILRIWDCPDMSMSLLLWDCPCYL